MNSSEQICNFPRFPFDSTLPYKCVFFSFYFFFLWGEGGEVFKEKFRFKGSNLNFFNSFFTSAITFVHVCGSLESLRVIKSNDNWHVEPKNWKIKLCNLKFNYARKHVKSTGIKEYWICISTSAIVIKLIIKIRKKVQCDKIVTISKLLVDHTYFLGRCIIFTFLKYLESKILYNSLIKNS